MMTLKYPEPIVRSHDQVIREPALFTLPPQGGYPERNRCAGTRHFLYGYSGSVVRASSAYRPSTSHRESYQRGIASRGATGALHRCSYHRGR